MHILLMIKTIRNEKIEKLEAHDLSFFITKQWLDGWNDGSQNFFLFQPIFHIFTMPAVITDRVVEWESEGLSNAKIELLITPSNSLYLKLRWVINSKIKVEFKGSCLKQDKVSLLQEMK